MSKEKITLDAVFGSTGNTRTSIISTGESPPAEFCKVATKNYCNDLRCDRCKALKLYVPDPIWTCVSCYDKHMYDLYKILPFHSSGKCHICGCASIALILTELIT